MQSSTTMQTYPIETYSNGVGESGVIFSEKFIRIMRVKPLDLTVYKKREELQIHG